jgi:hypothetical protein
MPFPFTNFITRFYEDVYISSFTLLLTGFARGSADEILQAETKVGVMLIEDYSNLFVN